MGGVILVQWSIWERNINIKDVKVHYWNLVFFNQPL